MSTTKRFLAAFTMMIAVVAAFTACDLLTIVEEVIVAELYEVDGTVVDARSESIIPAGVGSVDITLTAVAANEDGVVPSYTTATDLTGAFSVQDVEPGTYELTAVRDGWFVPPAKVTISGLAVDLDPVPAFELDPNDAYGLSFILTWNGNVDDLDLHVNFPTSWSDGQMETPYDDYTLGSSDYEVYWQQPTYDNDGGFPYNVVYQDRDDTDKYGPETTTLVQIPHSTAYGSAIGNTTISSTNDVTGLYAAFGDDALAYSFRWMGTAGVYVNAYTSGAYVSSGQGTSSADAVVYALQTLPKDPANFDFGSLSSYSSTDMESALLGVYRLPENTRIASARILRVNMFRDNNNYEWFQLVPEIMVIPEGPAANNDGLNATFLSTDAPAGGIVGVRGTAR